MLTEMVIEHGSPTLAGLKTGNLFSARNDKADIYKEVRELNNILVKKGLRVIPVKRDEKRTLIYIYRPDYLKRDLQDPKAKRILVEKGYDCSKAEQCICKLINCLKDKDSFPHEIGLFLVIVSHS